MSALEKKKEKARGILKKLKKLVPNAGIVLKYRSNWELLVAVILSAQCTDKKVNEVTRQLFKKYRRLDDYINAKRDEFEKDIRPTGFYKMKTKNILAAAKCIKKMHEGRPPRTMEEMLKIPGVGRKTANVVLGNAYGVVEGIAVDTHVFRLARKLGLSGGNTPEKVERDLMNLFSKKEWFRITYYLIEYGRKYCPARKHDHTKCPVR